MRTLLVALLSVLAACSGPASRIREKKDVFAAYPADVQEKIKAGRVDVGFTYEQVELALGRPDMRYTSTSEGGTSETWVYGGAPSHTGVGVTLGAGNWGSGVGGGITIGGSPRAADERERVIFKDGRVSSFEKREN
jgi:hypothetical protein